MASFAEVSLPLSVYIPMGRLYFYSAVAEAQNSDLDSNSARMYSLSVIDSNSSLIRALSVNLWPASLWKAFCGRSPLIALCQTISWARLWLWAIVLSHLHSQVRIPAVGWGTTHLRVEALEVPLAWGGSQAWKYSPASLIQVSTSLGVTSCIAYRLSLSVH